MKSLKFLVAPAAVGLLALFLVAGVAVAASYTLFGDAMIVSPGNASPHAVQIRSDATPGYGGIDFEVPAGTTFADLDQISTDFKIEADDFCVGGSPRFQIALDSDGDGDFDGNIFLYFGPDSAGAPCVPGTWQNTGDFLDASRLVDATQLGGAFYEPYALALAAYGSYDVLGISVVVDASWAHFDGEQTSLIDNTNVDGTLYTYDEPQNANECKKGGWMNLTRADGSTFKNQGDCIQYVNTGK